MIYLVCMWVIFGKKKNRSQVQTKQKSFAVTVFCNSSKIIRMYMYKATSYKFSKRSSTILQIKVPLQKMFQIYSLYCRIVYFLKKKISFTFNVVEIYLHVHYTFLDSTLIDVF